MQVRFWSTVCLTDEALSTMRRPVKRDICSSSLVVVVLEPIEPIDCIWSLGP